MLLLNELLCVDHFLSALRDLRLLLRNNLAEVDLSLEVLNPLLRSLLYDRLVSLLNHLVLHGEYFAFDFIYLLCQSVALLF